MKHSFFIIASFLLIACSNQSKTILYPAPEQEKKSDDFQSRQIRMAKSNDGITWEIMSYILPDSGIDACQIPQALVCKREGKWWLYVFYATQVGWRKGDVKYPFFKEDDYNWFYDQIRYMRQEIQVK